MKYAHHTLLGIIALAAAASAGAQSNSGGDLMNSPHSLYQNYDAIFATEMQAAQSQSVRYRIGEGQSFVLDRTRAVTLFKRSGDDEVFVLTSVSGPRGDEFLKNDRDQVIVRMTYLGGVIYYGGETRMGLPVGLDGVADAIAPPVPVSDFDSSAKASFATLGLGASDAVNLPNVAAYAVGWMQDAAWRSIDGIKKSGVTISSFELVEGDRPTASISDTGVLTVTFNPALGYEGRLSSGAIANIIQTSGPAS